MAMHMPKKNYFVQGPLLLGLEVYCVLMAQTQGIVLEMPS
jgi:hypothetical protein